MRRERGQEVACPRTKLGSRVDWTTPNQNVLPSLQLREILDALADTSLKGLLQRKAHAGNADHGATGMHGIGKGGIEFGPQADQAGSLGCGQFENARKP